MSTKLQVNFGHSFNSSIKLGRPHQNIINNFNMLFWSNVLQPRKQPDINTNNFL